MGQNNWRLAKNIYIYIWNRVTLSLRGENIIRNQIFVSKPWYIGQIYTIPNIKKEIEKENKISSGTGKSITS